jgi:large subunit ribosomal protein L10
MLRADKERVVAELAERLRSAQTLIVADYRGLTMAEIHALRTELLQHGARFSVVKNTLTRRAAESAGVDALFELLDGPTAIAFLEADGDPVAVAKALSDAARKTQVVVVRGGVLEGSAISDAEVRSLATLPSAEVLRAQLAGTIVGPLTAVVGLFAAPVRDFVNVIDARIRQLEEQDQGAGTPTEQPQPESRSGGAETVEGHEPETKAEPTEAESPEADQASGEERQEE